MSRIGNIGISMVVWEEERREEVDMQIPVEKAKLPEEERKFGYDYQKKLNLMDQKFGRDNFFISDHLISKTNLLLDQKFRKFCTSFGLNRPQNHRFVNEGIYLSYSCVFESICVAIFTSLSLMILLHFISWFIRKCPHH